MKQRMSLLVIVFAFVMIVGLTGLVSSAAKLPGTPKDKANVNFDFDGLIAICLGNPERASIGFLNVLHHTPRLSIVKVEANKQTTVIDLKGEQLHDTLSINVEGRKSGDIARYQGVSMDDANDFRWTIDMESDIFQKQLYIKEDKLFGKIHFGSGLFYAANLSEERVRFIAADNSSQMLSFDRRIAEPAMALNLQPNETLVIKGQHIDLRLAAESGVKYQISVTNIPPADMANMNHFLFYFNVMGVNVTPFEPIVVKKAAFTPRPKPIICAAVVFSKSTLN